MENKKEVTTASPGFEKIQKECNDRLNLLAQSYILQGARAMLSKLRDFYKFAPKMKGNQDDFVYVAAEIDCILSSKENTKTFLLYGLEGMRFRNHKRDKNSKLVSVEAYFENTISL